MKLKLNYPMPVDIISDLHVNKQRKKINKQRKKINKQRKKIIEPLNKDSETGINQVTNIYLNSQNNA